ncbi:tetratricopeptide repeat protein [Planosporangium mesophilum]|uniref:Co-chaperone YbbN n=1 Tax=Planosporangium mesophilum TaxID=689768 RepID=A0A8J3T911_9ACTN|nr:tetratricopeptide repeat protein [Planosporangium mesophilum]NJC81571.1 tetratricopeptide repeat protein [Planosporangium mesophilum]GII20771.1 co-chaperone YbbN [Planosporangium mesophilum]
MSDPRMSASIFTRGAVDLGALRTTPTAGQRPATTPGSPGSSGPGAGSPGDHAPAASGEGVAVIDVNEANFQREVLERSMTTPVVVDFWAEWCGPCKQLSPVLEKLAVEGDGSWVLAKVDVDANPRIAQMFRVQGIPMVYAIVGGQPVDAFTGVVPETQLRQWIDAVLKAGGVEVETPADPRLDAADDALVNGDLDAAEQAYRKILAESPADQAAEAGLAQVELLRRVGGVDPQAAIAEAAANPDDVEAQLRAADVEILSGQADRAYNRLVDLVRRTYGDDRERVRKHLLSLFSMAGPDDPAVAAARRALANALF